MGKGVLVMANHLGSVVGDVGRMEFGLGGMRLVCRGARARRGVGCEREQACPMSYLVVSVFNDSSGCV